MLNRSVRAGTRPSRWDAFLRGEASALTDAEKTGFNTFTAMGCQWCHYGPYACGSEYQKLGVMEPWPGQTDQGRYQVTKNETDKMVFKVPSLRNIQKTGPYFHDGSVSTLDQAIRNMAVHQRGVTATEAQERSIEVWMDSLTGQVPKSYIRLRNFRRARREYRARAVSNFWQAESGHN